MFKNFVTAAAICSSSVSMILLATLVYSEDNPGTIPAKYTLHYLCLFGGFMVTAGIANITYLVFSFIEFHRHPPT